MYKSEYIIKHLNKIPYATVYNFQPWTNSKATNVKSSVQWPYNIVKKLVKSGELKQMTIYPPYINERVAMDRQFYTARTVGGKLNPDGKAKSGDKYRIARSMLEHESGLMDVLLGFLHLFEGYEIQIDTAMKFSVIRKNSAGRQSNADYWPDAVIRMKSPEMKTYDFIVEFERTKTDEQIRKDKFRLSEAIDSPQKYGLSKMTKFIYVYTYELYNVFWRPMEYPIPEVQRQMAAVERRLSSLIRSSQLSDKYRFLPFHDFYRLNQNVWLNHKGEKVQLIG